MISKKNVNRIVITALIFVVSILFLQTGCRVQLIADYDASAAQDIIHTYKEVDHFYQTMEEVDSTNRTYDRFAGAYDSIESDLRVLVLKNAVRPLNQESTKIAENILSLWQKYRDAHKKNNSYKDALILLHRDRFFENFKAMLVAEQAKPKSKS